MTNAQKRFVSIAVKKCWNNTMAVPQKTFIRSVQVTNHKSVRARSKSTVHRVRFEPEPNPTKVVYEKSLRSRWWPVSLAKLVMWQLFHLSIVERSIVSSIPQFVCLKFSEKLKKRTRKDESLSHIGSNQRLFDRPKRGSAGSNAVQP